MWALEAVEGKVGLGRQILGFLMAPPFLMSVLLIIILIIAWKRELVGGILIALIGLATAAYVCISTFHRLLHMASKGYRSVRTTQSLNFSVMSSLPLIIVGVFFIISYFLHRPKKLTAQTP
jgi:amino acid permease